MLTPYTLLPPPPNVQIYSPNLFLKYYIFIILRHIYQVSEKHIRRTLGWAYIIQGTLIALFALFAKEPHIITCIFDIL